jgi:integrase
VNVHLFRHLAVKLSLMENPEDIETPRRVLGHRSINTTLRAYSEMRSVEALRRYDNIIARLRDKSA